MSSLKTMYILIGVILLQPTLSDSKSSDDLITRALEFIVDMHSQNHTEHEFLSKIQTLFCPDQPVCKQHDVIESPIAQNIDLMTSHRTNQKEIFQPLGVCCLPCSCVDNACTENDNCCLTKQAVDLGKDHPSSVDKIIENDCIAATSKSYFSKTNVDFKYPHYYMVTRCFSNRENVTLVTRCEQPDTHDLKVDETIPVYSKATGRTYWNKYCAICQNDSQDVVTWDAIIHMNRDYHIFNHRSTPVTPAQNFSHFYDMVVNAGEVIYTKPSKIEPSLEPIICIPKKTILQADETNFHALCKKQKVLQDACQNFDSPSVVYGIKGPQPYKNMFCLLCQTRSISLESEPDCELDVFKGKRPSYTALLNQNFMVEGNLKRGGYEKEHASQQGCPCYKILDNVQHICRPVYCPPDEYLVLCQCMPFASRTSGMPFLLYIKVQPTKGALQQQQQQADDFMTLSAAIRKALRKRYKRINFETMAIFYSNNTGHEYLLLILRAREDQGYDAQSSFKELAGSVEGPPFLRIVSGNYSYEAELTNSIIMWKDPLGVYRANDTKIDVTLQGVYMDNGLVSSLRWSQELSKLLFCRQVELNGTEYSESHGVVTINVSSIDYQTTHYYHTATDKIRICTEDFREAFPVKSLSCVLQAYTYMYTVFLGFLKMTRLY